MYNDLGASSLYLRKNRTVPVKMRCSSVSLPLSRNQISLHELDGSIPQDGRKSKTKSGRQKNKHAMTDDYH